MFIVFLTSIGNASNHTKCISINNKKCEIQRTLTNLHPNEYSRRVKYTYFKSIILYYKIIILY